MARGKVARQKIEHTLRASPLSCAGCASARGDGDGDESFVVALLVAAAVFRLRRRASA